MGSNVRYTRDGHRYDIRVRLEGPRPRQILRRESARSSAIPTGELVPMKDLVTIVEKPSLQTISRRNRERAISVYANMTPGHSQQEVLKKVEEIGKKILPSGYHVVLTGSAQTYRESFQSLAVAMLLGIVVSYMGPRVAVQFLHPAGERADGAAVLHLGRVPSRSSSRASRSTCSA